LRLGAADRPYPSVKPCRSAARRALEVPATAVHDHIGDAVEGLSGGAQFVEEVLVIEAVMPLSAAD
jgi:hypothetical protein